MSRNFKDEYKNMMAEEVPDLWNRIELNLKDKYVTANPSPSRVTTQKEKSKTNASIYRMKYAVAACLCLVILLGGAMSLSRKSAETKSNDMTSDMVMIAEPEFEDSVDITNQTDTIPEERFEAGEMDGADLEEAYEETEDGAQVNGTDTELLEENLDMNPSDSKQDSGADLQSDAGQLQSTESANVGTQAESKEGSNTEVNEQDGVKCQAVLRITSIENTGEEILYYGEVMPSVYSVLQPGEVIAFCIGDMDISEPEMDKTYKVTLEYFSKETAMEPMYMLRDLEVQSE